MTKRLSLLTLVLLFAIACPSLADKIIYVDADAAGANDGTSWANAYNYLQDGLADANSAVKPVEIRVAVATYRPDRSSADPNGTGDREATFQLVRGVAIKGGYAGFGEPDPNARDIQLYETILSGDLDGDDVQVPPSDLLTEPSRGENSYHVLTGSGTNATAVLDGFIITGGNAIDFPFPHYKGGGIFNHYGTPMLLNCIFFGNAALSGGAVANSDTGEWDYTNDPTVIINCLFSGNLAYSGGGAISNNGAKAEIINCTFNCNTAERYGGGIKIGQCSSLIVTNSIFWGNIDKDGTGETSQITAWYKDINYSCIQGWTGSFGGTGNIGNDPLFLDADGADNVLGTLDDNPRLLQGSACIDAGDNSAVPPLVLTDLGGGARIANGTVDMGAYEGAHQGFLLNTEQVTVPEGSTATFTVVLVMDPLGTVEVAVTRYSGDLDITVETGTSLTFDSSNYSEAQTVTLAAAEDTDSLDGTALIWVNAEGFAAAGVSASEEDNEPVPAVLFVDDSAPGTSEAEKGASWLKAFTDLQEALRIATTNSEVAEIRVAQGIYTPTEPDGYREATFQLSNGVAIKGGYAGFGELDPNARDIELYATILSGDLNGDDADVSNPADLMSEPTRAENSYNVVTGNGTDATTVLDGFTITAGNANGSSPWTRNNRGGGINGGSATLANCTISWNSAGEHGGGLNGCDGPITNCTISGNACEDRGGGLNSCAGPITNCTISINSSGHEGGGLHSSGNAGINNCVISRNSASIGGGMYNMFCSPRINNCTFTGNTAAAGGGIYNDEESDTRLTNCILWANSPPEILLDYLSSASIIYSDVHGGWPGLGNIDAEPLFVDSGRWVDANDPNIIVEPSDPNAVWVDGDYHLKSQAGRYDPNTETWIIDDVTSPCIDTGDPMSPIGPEPFPNGGIVNMGAFGGTVEASKSYFGKPPCETIVAGDINGDCVIDFKDFRLMALHWAEDNDVPVD